MSRMTKEINRISMMVISVSGKLIFYAAVLVLLTVGARRGYAFGHSIFYAPGMDPEPGVTKTLKLKGNESVQDVGKTLEKNGLIEDSAAFTIQALCYG